MNVMDFVGGADRVARDETLDTICRRLLGQKAAKETLIELRQLQLQTASPGAKADIIDEIEELQGEIAALNVLLDQYGCPEEMPPPPISNIGITGVERTQVIQFFDSLLSPCPDRPGIVGPCPDNAIALVAGKVTVLRVYTDVTAFASVPTISSVSGVLWTRQSGSGTWQLPITPINAPINPRPAADVQRDQVDHTLNFRIPAARCRGTMEYSIRAFDAGRPGEAGYTSMPAFGTISFVQTAPLKLRLVRIRYRNTARNMDIPAPSLGDFLTTTEFLLKTYPISEIGIVRDSVELYDGDFTSFFDSGCPGAQGTTGVIFRILKNLLDSEGFPDDVQYLALIPGPPANQTGSSGHATARKNIVEVLSGPTMAHELGHNSGLPFHAPCPQPGAAGSPPGPDPNYPDYDAYPPASIGEFGFDAVNSTVYDPATHHDFMSYCGPRWVSPYTYEILMKRFLLPPAARTIRPVEAVSTFRELLFLSTTICRDGAVILHGPGFHLKGPVPALVGTRTPYSVELYNKEGRILEAQRLHLDDVHKSLDDACLDFSVALPWHAEAGQMVFKREDRILESIEIGNVVPGVEITQPKGVRRLDGVQVVKWQASCDGKELRHVLRYSNDGGESWYALAMGLKSEQYEVNMNDLPGGDKCLFEVLSTEGIRTGRATSDTFAVKRKPVTALIVSPVEGATFLEGESIHFLGAALSPSGSAPSRTLNWTSSIDGHLGVGHQLVEHTLSVGRHRISLEADDGCGGESTVCVYITVMPTGRRADWYSTVMGTSP